ncbi:MAG: type II toxin-antitoxin system VapC family toxin [Sulfurimonas sp.]|uniref:type II toxin-antitoxin system VapC family toxin n=1 Tax=Sulfurimonas sp. TaxID=2022749 RepID=UPI00260AE42E|nr:type II toxin-antitoxin system VapC family toxin [Sulfurimonas sp.]MDD2652771.1 type II toxin-antitoxin system VapC family toxin [Sulfurimonas sp.]MDD3452082.1 type II toxin-antitoxin system VapC family toxin [Sulfurimonas sp.]
MSKKIFLDTNVVADIIDAKRENHTKAMKLMEKTVNDNYVVCISEDMLTTLFYISKNKKETLEFFQNVIFIDWEILNFTKDILQNGVELSLQNALDLEDVLQCLCAKQSGCETIVTNDNKFYNCGIEVKSYDYLIYGA